ncbi:hypothetical protein [Synechococcus sp. MIT S1220]|uniref:hypothetical protein n=1 Tax=Synechococcus sp. MIT S1220 TaxID=3082549 RepID=UPI0039AEC9E0
MVPNQLIAIVIAKRQIIVLRLMALDAIHVSLLFRMRGNGMSLSLFIVFDSLSRT